MIIPKGSGKANDPIEPMNLLPFQRRFLKAATGPD